MLDFFFYGTLCHPPLLEAVLGRAVRMEPARLADHAVHWAEGQSFPILLSRPGSVAPGGLVRGLGEEDARRLDYYEGGFAYRVQTVAVGAGAETVSARVYLPGPGRWEAGGEWSLADWARRWGPAVTEQAATIMAGYGRVPPEQALSRYAMRLARAADRLRARAAPAPARLRRSPVPGDLQVAEVTEPWARFFAVEEWRLRHRRFDGTMSAELTREVFVTPDAVTVLPYDPVRDRVLVVEQFRAGPAARGDDFCWQIEAVAGLIDAGEGPEEAARREAEEEAGLRLGALHAIGGHYPSPGARTEFVYGYVAIADLPDSAGGIGGMAHEGEDIRSHVLSFAALMDLVESGEAAAGPLLISAYWLAAHREQLRAQAG